ncbi:histidine kinase [Algoriphagus halophytocola]|uniref:Histidine kinase n=1 Tax=Algoriphagus halophytocola TaxID=2991499 RepID=A0ABY6MH61_9BACT|nr:MULTISPECIES: histidine kinase [unclassified Algoriphagus]UZD23123.1 histidine kinase [Algoriphagus sp. TR-M5]WBL44415.1 histidine kinase [Algoriphagus sp. TR-M9]
MKNRKTPISPAEIEEILLHFSDSITELETEEEILWDMVKNCISILDFEDAVVYLLDRTGEYLEQKAAIGPKNPEGKKILNPLRIKIGEGITGQVASTGIPRLIADTRLEPNYIKDDVCRLSEIAVPILLMGKVIGVIDSENSQPDFFTNQHLKILLAVASIYAGRIAHIRALETIKESELERWKIKQKATKLQMEVLSAQLSPHFVFNSLNAIQHYIILEDKIKSLRFLSVFGKLLRYFMGQIDKESVLVKEELQMLDWYLQLQKLRYENKLIYKISSGNIKNHPQARIPAIIVQSLIENLLEENISKSNGNSEIELGFHISPTEVKFNVMINNLSSLNHQDETSNYFKSLTPWQEYVSLLNEIRPFEIRSEVVERTAQDKSSTLKSVKLIFPNLAHK